MGSSLGDSLRSPSNGRGIQDVDTWEWFAQSFWYVDSLGSQKVAPDEEAVPGVLREPKRSVAEMLKGHLGMDLVSELGEGGNIGNVRAQTVALP